MHAAIAHTFDGVGLDQLRAVDEECLWNGLPFHARWHAQIDVCRRQLVDVEPDVLGPCILDQVLV